MFLSKTVSFLKTLRKTFKGSQMTTYLIKHDKTLMKGLLLERITILKGL